MRLNLLALALGIASATGFAPLGLWPLTLLAFALLLWLVQGAPRLRSALARGWWFGVGHFALGLNWIATAFTYQAEMPAWLGWIAVVLLSLYLAVYPAVAAGLAWRWARGDGLRLALVFAAAWIVTEWLRASLFTGFAWNPLGVVALSAAGPGVSYLAGSARWIGTYGLSGVLLLFAGVWALALVRLFPAFDRGLTKPHADIGFRFIPKKLAGDVLLVAVPILLFMIGPGSGSEPSRPGSSELALRIIQPNIGQQDKWREDFIAENEARLAGMSRRGEGRPRLLLWPEAAVTRPLQNELAYPRLQQEAAMLRARVGRMMAPADLLLTGGVTWRSADGFDITSATNSVFAMDRSGRIHARYDKSHLVPYGEYLPMRPILSAIGLSRLAPGDIDFDSGPGPQTLDLPVVGKVGFQLCYEIIFSGQVVERGNRPNFLFNPSNDAWFGAWGPPQHLAQARLRALEEGLPVLRSTPTGISAVIDAKGQLLHSLPWRRAGVIDATLPPPLPPTLFARLGNIAPLILSLLLAGAAVVVARRARTIAGAGEAR
ncbi:MAG TPA: apolipoprotein N-acyltransferase [Allosphingosinicella sp.]|nr:apolipoprotein N-acyltransferase [Allosphingosinicella sp.]